MNSYPTKDGTYEVVAHNYISKLSEGRLELSSYINKYLIINTPTASFELSDKK
jgi:hypothetical protein